MNSSKPTQADELQKDPRRRFEAREYTDESGGRLKYRLLRPTDYNASKQYPLVLFFHGAGERGDDNYKQLVHGMGEFADDAIMKKYPCFVIAPQCPENQQWVNTLWTAPSHTMPENPTACMRQSIELVTALQKEFSIQKDRIYVTGLSMGGFGVWDAICRHPQLFAAAVPICGGGDTLKAASISHIPVWDFHGESDPAVNVKRSRDMIAALKATGGKPRYTEYLKTGHNSWKATYDDPELFRWLFEQKKSPGQ